MEQNEFNNMKAISLREQQLLQLNVLKEVDRICEKHGLHYAMMYGTLIGAVRHKGFIPWDDDIDIVMPRQEYNRFLELCAEGNLSEPYVIQNTNTDKNFEFGITRVCIKGTVSCDSTRRYCKGWRYTYLDIFPLDNASKDKQTRAKHRKKLGRILRIIGLKMNYVYKNESRLKRFIKTVVAFVLKCIPLRMCTRKFDKEAQRYNTEPGQYYYNAAAAFRDRDEIFEKTSFTNTTRLEFEGNMFCAPQEYDAILTKIYGDYMKLPPKSERVVRHGVMVEENFCL